MLAATTPSFSRESLLSDSELNRGVALTHDNVHVCTAFLVNVALLLALDAHDDAALAERDGLKGEAVWNRVALQLVDVVKVHQRVRVVSMQAPVSVIHPSGSLQCLHVVVVPCRHSNCSFSRSSSRFIEHRPHFCMQRVARLARGPAPLVHIQAHDAACARSCCGLVAARLRVSC
jgi:hypothetical protein